MKRDMELIRKFLLHVEEHDNLDFKFPEYDDHTVAYHARLLITARYLNGVAQTALGGKIILQDTGITGLTWKGHEFLDAAREESRWNKAKNVAKEKAGSISMKVLTDLLIAMMRQSVGL